MGVKLSDFPRLLGVGEGNFARIGWDLEQSTQNGKLPNIRQRLILAGPTDLRFLKFLSLGLVLADLSSEKSDPSWKWHLGPVTHSHSSDQI